MKYWVTNDCNFGWREPVSLIVQAENAKAAAEKVNLQLRDFGRRIHEKNLKEWDFDKAPILMLTTGGLNWPGSKNILISE